MARSLLDNIDISTPYGKYQQSLEYDWRPTFCSNCMKFGHERPKCWNKVDEGGVEEKSQEKKKRKKRNRRKSQHPVLKEMRGQTKGEVMMEQTTAPLVVEKKTEGKSTEPEPLVTY